jgi:hypothetical protein
MDATEVLITPSLLNNVPEPIFAPSLPLKATTSSSSCPWSKIAAVETVSLNDVMSEQLAKSLEEADEANNIQQNGYVDDLTGRGEEVSDCSDDFLLAKMLQLCH